MKKRTFLFVFCLIANVSLWAIPTDKVDSLLHQIYQVEEVERLPLLVKVSQELAQDSFYLAYKYAEDALLLAEKNKNLVFIADILTWQGDLWRIYSPDEDESRYAVSPYQQAWELYAMLKDTLGMGICQTKIGKTYKIFSNYENAIPYYFKAIGLFGLVNNPDLMVDAYLDIGEIYYAKEDWENAISVAQKAQQISEEHGMEKHQIRIHSSLGEAYMAKEEFMLAKHHYEKVFQLQRTFLNALPTSSLNLQGFIYLKADKPDSAKLSFDAAYHKIISQNDSSQLADVYAGWAEYAFRKGNMELALTYLKPSTDLAKSHQLWERVLGNYWLLSQIYEAQQNYFHTSTALRKYYQLRDSLENVKQEILIHQLRIMYEHDIQEEKLETLEAQNQNQELLLESERYKKMLAWAIAILLFVILAFLFIQYLQNQRTNIELERQVGERTQQLRGVNQELKVLNDELDVLSYRTAHDIRGPVARLLGLCQVAENELTMREEKDMYLDLIHKEALNMDVMLHRFLEVNKIKHASVNFIELNLYEFVESVFKSNQGTPGYNNIYFSNKISSSLYINADAELLRIIIKNLIENAIIFSDVSAHHVPRIEILAFEQKSDIILLIRDNGIGIPEEYTDRIFEMFFRASPISKGLGLGLYAVNLATKKLDGQVKVNTRQKRLTEFEVRLPQRKDPTEDHATFWQHFFQL